MTCKNCDQEIQWSRGDGQWVHIDTGIPSCRMIAYPADTFADGSPVPTDDEAPQELQDQCQDDSFTADPAGREWKD